ncbi:MAG: dehydrogenase E1 component subunit alpha/beta [Cyclobacteriaceae bacterium]|nr:dehydrogenase E1 component subunit alpha/beta [Cyclobacteriaceae bacterium SS2]
MSISFEQGIHSKKELISIYRELLTPRLIEERMLLLLRQGKISKWFSGIGQEAVSVGATLALNDDDFIMSMHRNLGVFTSRKVPMVKLFHQLKGSPSGYTKGRDRSFHFGTIEHHIVGMISHLGAQLGVADGIALAHKLKKEKRVTLAISGDGGTSEGDFHEAVNLASVWNLPVIFLIENNGYGLSTPSNEQFNFDSFVVKGPAYGISAYSLDGNNILEVIDQLSEIAKEVRKTSQPVIVEARTFRMRGHEEASGTKYVPKKLMDEWARKDPVESYEKFLLKKGIMASEELEKVKSDISQEILFATKEVYESDDTGFLLEEEEQDIFHPYEQVLTETPSAKVSEKRFVDAISDGLNQCLEKHDHLILMGQDIAEYGGVFKVTEGFVEKFSKDRIRNTPISESAVIGAGLGLSIAGMKSVIEMQFADFVSCGFNQLVNNVAKSHYRWGQNADVVIRLPTGANVNAGPFHSQSTEAWFFHVPGLKIVYPSNSFDAKGLLCAAIEDPNPVLYFEHKYLYRSAKDHIPDDYYTLPIGKANLIREGKDLCIITYGLGVLWAEEALDTLEITASLLDLRSLQPWDKEAVKEAVKTTGKVLILHEDTLTGGIGAEIAAWISENCFEYLDAPVMRCASLNTPVPFAKELEDNFLPKSRLMDKIQEIMRY